MKLDPEGQANAQSRAETIEDYAQSLEDAAAVARARAAAIRKSWNLPAPSSQEKRLTTTHEPV